MRRLKAIDLSVQLILIPACIMLALVGGELLFTAYFIVGGWQILSAITHLLLRRHYLPLKARKYYTITAFILISGLPLFLSSSLTNSASVVYYGFGMLIISPFLAFWYLYICFEEKKRLTHKEFVHLK